MKVHQPILIVSLVVACQLAGVSAAREIQLRNDVDGTPVSRSVSTAAGSGSPSHSVQRAQFLVEDENGSVLVDPGQRRPPAPPRAGDPVNGRRDNVTVPHDRIERHRPTRPGTLAPSTSSPILHSHDGWHEAAVHGCEAGCCFRGGVGPLRDHLWASAEILLWWRRGLDLPPLVTTSPLGTDPEVAGRLGQPTTSILLGAETIDSRMRAGGRYEVGHWLDTRHCWAVAGRYFHLGTDTARFRADSNQVPIIAQPFLNVTDNITPRQDTQLVAFPGETQGDFNFLSESRVWGTDVYFRRLWHEESCIRVDFLFGYQTSRIDGDMVLDRHTVVSDPTTLLLEPGTTFSVTDRFDTRNEFHGGTIGLLTSQSYGCWTVNMLGKLGLGNMRQTVTIDGTTVVDDTQTVEVTPEGFLARSTNMGVFRNDQFSVVPELDLKLACRLRPHLELTVGYSLILWTRVTQPPDQLDPQLAVNLAEPPQGEQRPAFEFDDHTFWVQGLNFGLRWNY